MKAWAIQIKKGRYLGFKAKASLIDARLFHTKKEATWDLLKMKHNSNYDASLCCVVPIEIKQIKKPPLSTEYAKRKKREQALNDAGKDENGNPIDYLKRFNLE